MKAGKQNLTVQSESDGRRVDVFIAESIEGMTRSRAKQIIDQGFVSVDGNVVKPSAKVTKGQVIELRIPETIEIEIVPQDIALDVLFEDEHIIAINKPAGMVVHPAAGNPDNTLVNALLAHCNDLSGIGGELRPGIVHRLDKGTTGVIVAAKNDEAHNGLSEQFAGRSLQKQYLAIVLGIPSTQSGTWDEPIGRHPTDRKKMSTRSRSPKAAVTHFKVLGSKSNVSALLLKIDTGRTHQIRVHCANAGCPVASDQVYGGVKRIKSLKNEKLKGILVDMDNPALHSFRLIFKHPASGKELMVEAPIPETINQVIKILGAEIG